ncbi:unnamed protein product [Meganyctiphanes norvegica]|uniref:Uncharacterized protein n=1 Tax=Meganyctiphanes norvegica TaxID=48144 RepID=A0AAV2R3J1_MEGNR
MVVGATRAATTSDARPQLKCWVVLTVAVVLVLVGDVSEARHLRGQSHLSQCDIAGKRHILARVEQICTDCRNLYGFSNEAATVGHNCRQQCYANPHFELCMRDVMMGHRIMEYRLLISLLQIS